MLPIRDIADAADPLALHRAAVAAWPLALAIALDWPIVRWLQPGRTRSPFTAAAIANLAAALTTTAAMLAADRLTTWLPAQFGDGLIQLIAEQRLRPWHALVLLALTTATVVPTKAGILRLLTTRWPNRPTLAALTASWAASLILLWFMRSPPA